MKCRYCCRNIKTHRAKEYDEFNKPHAYTEWLHSDDSLFCDTTHRTSARPQENLSVAKISRLYPDATIISYHDSQAHMPYVCRVDTHELAGDRMRLVSHIYTGWDRDKLSLERTEYAY